MVTETPTLREQFETLLGLCRIKGLNVKPVGYRWGDTRHVVTYPVQFGASIYYENMEVKVSRADNAQLLRILKDSNETRNP